MLKSQGNHKEYKNQTTKLAKLKNDGTIAFKLLKEEYGIRRTANMVERYREKNKEKSIFVASIKILDLIG